MSNFNFYLNRQGIRGRQGEKGDKGEQGYSPYIEIKSDTPTEFIMTIHNENESFDTPNLIPQSIGNKVAELDADMSELKPQTQANTEAIRSINDSISILNDKTKPATSNTLGIVKPDGTTITVTEDGIISANSSGALPIASTTQLGGVKVDGTSIIADENGVISSVGGGGAGDVTSNGNNVFTGNNKFKKDVTIDCNSFSGNSLVLVDSTIDPNTDYATLRMGYSEGLTINSHGEGIKLNTYLSRSQIEMSKNGDIWFTSEKPLMHRNFQGSGTDVPLVTQENIKAGENITLNKNAETGDIIISSTGGSGGTGDVPIATTEVAGKVKPDGTTITVTEDGTISANSSYTLPTASTTQLGGVKVDGTSVTINSDGVISAAGGGGGDVPIATTETAGKVKPDGTTITVTEDGTISAVPTTPTNMVTTDSDQTINGTKIFANGTGTTFTGTSSNSNSLTIDADDKEIRFNSANSSPAVIRNQGLTTTDLNIGDNFNSVKITTTLYDKDGVEIVGGSGGGSAPENMVTTDTVQDITAYKTFSGGLQTTTLNASTGVRTSANIDLLQDISGVTSATKASIQPVMTDGLMGINLKAGKSDSPDEKGNYKKGKVTYNGTEILKNDLSNISDVGSTACALQAMPSTRYVDITLGASQTQYTAPGTGYISIIATCSDSANKFMELTNVSGGYRAIGWTQSNTSVSVELFLPVKSGQTFRITYNGTFTASRVRLYYLEGVPSA